MLPTVGNSVKVSLPAVFGSLAAGEIQSSCLSGMRIWVEVLVEDRANITILLVQVSTTLMCIVPRGPHCLGACEAFDDLGAKRAE